MLKRAKYLIIQAAALAMPATAFAAGNVVPDILKGFAVPEIIRGIVRFILIAAFVIAFIMLLVGGIRWILAGGDEKAVASARGMITGALIGLVIVVAAFAIIKLVETFFGFSILTNIQLPCVVGANNSCPPGTVSP